MEAEKIQKRKERDKKRMREYRQKRTTYVTELEERVGKLEEENSCLRK